MSEQELLESFIQDRINMLITDYRKSHKEEESKDYSDAETIIDRLPDKEREIVENYINQIIDTAGFNEPFLYKQGFFDGVKVMRAIMKL